MKNPNNNSSNNWYILAINGETHFITTSYSPRGVGRAWKGYSDTVLAHAGGYGYDKESTVLADACALLAKMPQLDKAGGTGVNNVKKLVAETGGRLYDRSDANDFIHKDIDANNY